jgi:hypothetical protein
VILKLFAGLDILGNVNLMHRISRQQRLVLGASMIALTVALPAAFGLDLITNTQDQEQIVEATPSPESAPPAPEEPAPSAEPSPEPSPQVTGEASPAQSAKPTVEPTVESSAESTVEPTVEPSEKPTPKPIPVHALANQSMYLIAPKQVSVDPRATTTTLPAITVGSSETLLLCAFSDKAIFHVPYIPYIPVAIDPKKPELGSRNSFLIQGQGSSHLRISGPSYAVMSAFNGGNGMRITSSSRAISGGQILLRFVNMSEPSLDGSFCGQGSVSNNRSISIRALGIDLQMLKADVNLKRNK